MNKFVVEFIGSFFLVFVVTLVSINTSGPMGVLAIGATLAALVFSGWHISGAHYNPAVTLAIFLRGKCSFSDVPGYIISQLLGAGFAAALVSFFLLNKQSVALTISGNAVQCLVSELIGTFALVYVYLNVTTSKSTLGNSFYGLAIGLITIGLNMGLAHISGGLLNPGLALGLGVAGLSSFSNLWIFWIGELVGAVLAAYCFLFINGSE